MANFRQARQALVQRMLEGNGTASHAQRRAAFDNAELEEPLHTLIEKVARHSEMVTDEDFMALRASHLSEDQISNFGNRSGTFQRMLQLDVRY
jgi:alkylhydroperoxidase family enzyme